MGVKNRPTNQVVQKMCILTASFSCFRACYASCTITRQACHDHTEMVSLANAINGRVPTTCEDDQYAINHTPVAPGTPTCAVCSLAQRRGLEHEGPSAPGVNHPRLGLPERPFPPWMAHGGTTLPPPPGVLCTAWIDANGVIQFRDLGTNGPAGTFFWG